MLVKRRIYSFQVKYVLESGIGLERKRKAGRDARYVVSDQTSTTDDFANVEEHEDLEADKGVHGGFLISIFRRQIIDYRRKSRAIRKQNVFTLTVSCFHLPVLNELTI